jgi:Protein of unknown function (DUF2924)
MAVGNLKARPTAELARGLSALKNWDFEALCKEWKRLFRKKIPLNLPQYILLRMIAYRMQANALGDLDSNYVKYLSQVAAQRATRMASKIGARAGSHHQFQRFLLNSRSRPVQF